MLRKKEQQGNEYNQEYGTELNRQVIDSDAYFKAAKQDLVTIIKPENKGPPNGMLTYVDGAKWL